METIQAPTYPTSVLNAEPIARASADAGILAAVNLLNLAQPILGDGARWGVIARTPTDYRDLLDGLLEDTQLAKTGTRLTNEAKLADVRRIAAAWRTEAEALVVGLETRATEWTAELEAFVMPDPPSTDPSVLQAMLGNARADARMVADASADDDLADRLGELARGDDPAVRYLILASSWPATLFRARDAKTAPVVWPSVRRAVLAEVLTGARLGALDRLDALVHVRKAAHAIRGGHALLIANNSTVFPGERTA